MLRPWRNDASPLLRKITAQPAEPGFDGGVQYRPIDSNVATARAPIVGRAVVAGCEGVPPPVAPPDGGVFVPPDGGAEATVGFEASAQAVPVQDHQPPALFC